MANLQTQYMDGLLATNEREHRLNIMADSLRSVEFDAIAFQGMSGCLIAPGLAARLNKSLIMVRKGSHPYHHSAYKVEGDLEAKTYIIADDFYESGATLRNIVMEIKAFNPKAKCVGVVMSKSYTSGVHSLKEMKKRIKETGKIKW